MKDWTGNKKAVYITLCASNHSKNERQGVDFYATDPHALEIVLNRLSLDGIKLPKKIYDQTTTNMIQGLKGIFARKPLISIGI